MRKFLGFTLFLAGSWLLVSPQSLTGLAQLKWMYKYAFPGEVLIGIVVVVIAYYLLNFKPNKKVETPDR
jgi:ABC-type antimicrobial peptide transport system permease subunit